MTFESTQPTPFCLEKSSVRKCKRTSDGGNRNHSVSLPIILIEIKGDQMLPSSCWSLFYDNAFHFLFPWMYGFFGG